MPTIRANTYPRVWGLYLFKDENWLRDRNGEIRWFISPHLAQAHKEEIRKVWGECEAFVKEFGDDCFDEEVADAYTAGS